MKTATLLLTALLALLVLPAFATPSAGLRFTPQAGFGGASEGNGTLKLLFGAERPYRVQNDGRRLADGTFSLDQTVVFQGKPPMRRHWILTTVRPDTCTGAPSAMPPVA